MAGNFVSDFVGTATGYIKLALAGVRLKDNSGNLAVRNNADSADASVTASTYNASGNTGLVINSDAAGTGSDYSITLARPASGMSANWTMTLPVSAGTSGFVLQTDGSGNTSWVSTASATNLFAVDTTSLAFGSSSSVSMFTLPANASVQYVRVEVDTLFNGTPSMSVGISGNTSKYMASTQVSLAGAGETAPVIFEVQPGITPTGSTESLIITYSAGGASAGAARVLVGYVIPS